jgi:alpha-D-xyloside xylohydrolase
MVSPLRDNQTGLLTYSQGMWMVAEGKRLEYAEDIYSITSSEDNKKLSLLCPTAQIRSRGDTLNRPTISLV